MKYTIMSTYCIYIYITKSLG